MPDITDRPAICCPDCGAPYPGAYQAPEYGMITPVWLTCTECGSRHIVSLWIADVVRQPTSPPQSARWPDDPEEERLHGPTVERRIP